jgi:exodeoxyribonuclease VII large subunit
LSTPARKRPIPAFPRRVAVVTSRSAAALQDVLDTMRRRWPAIIVQLVDVRVQGDGAAEEVAGALRWLGHRAGENGTDVILVTRGGGSMEDLWAFNERVVAEAIVGSPIPVVAAIGHETDITIAELVADLRCATPSQAAMRLTPDLAAAMEQLDALATQMRSAVVTEIDQVQQIDSMGRHLRLVMHGRVQSIATRLERLSGRLESHRPTALHARRIEALNLAEVRLVAAMRSRLGAINIPSLADRLARAWAVADERIATHLAGLHRQLGAVGPMSVLRRGFSYTLLEDGRLLKSPTDAAAGDRLLTRLADGEVRSIVEGPVASPLSSPSLQPPIPRPVRSKPSPKPPGLPQMDLFNPGR